MRDFNMMKKKTVIFTLALILASVVSTSGIARTLDEFVRLASFEAFPEIRQAAGIALVPLWVDSELSDDELRQFGETGISAEIRGAAGQALGIRLATAAIDANALIDLILSDDFGEIQEAASTELLARLNFADLSLDELLAFAGDSRNELIRSAAIPALTLSYSNSDLSDRELNEIANTGSTSQIRQSAANALASRLTLDSETLLDLVSGSSISVMELLEGSNPELRAAGQPLYAESLANSNPELDDLIELASDSALTKEVRAAAGEVFAERLLEVNLPLDELEALATGATEELRKAAHTALVIATVGAVGARVFSLSELAGLVATSESEELAEARAEAVLVLLRGALSTLDGQDYLELIANGGTAVVNGVIVNGGEHAFRVAAADFLVGIYTFFGFIDRFADPLADLAAIAANPELSEEWRTAAGIALAQVYRAEGERAAGVLGELDDTIDELLLALGSGDLDAVSIALGSFIAALEAERESIVQTAEVAGDFTVRQRLDDIDVEVTSISQALEDNRPFVINSSATSIKNDLAATLRSIEEAPNVSTSELESIVVEGETTEIRAAAGDALSFRYQRDLSDLDQLFDIARVGISPELRLAVIPALANKLAIEFTQEELIALSEDDFSVEVRLAAAQALFSSFSASDFPPALWGAFANGGELPVGSLELVGDNIEIRRAFAPVLTARFLESGETLESLSEIAANGTTQELREAAGSALESLYSQPDGPPIDELVELAGFDPAPEIQNAAGSALAERLISEEASEGEIVALIAKNSIEIRLDAAPALGDGLAGALAYRFMNEQI